MAKSNLLNVRNHLKHAEMIKAGLDKYGYCPAIEEELRRFFFINKALLNKAEKLKEKNRKDLPLV